MWLCLSKFDGFFSFVCVLSFRSSKTAYKESVLKRKIEWKQKSENEPQSWTISKIIPIWVVLKNDWKYFVKCPFISFSLSDEIFSIQRVWRAVSLCSVVGSCEKLNKSNNWKYLATELKLGLDLCPWDNSHLTEIESLFYSKYQLWDSSSGQWWQFVLRHLYRWWLFSQHTHTHSLVIMTLGCWFFFHSCC